MPHHTVIGGLLMVIFMVEGFRAFLKGHLGIAAIYSALGMLTAFAGYIT